MTFRTSSPEQKARPSGEPVSTMQRHSGSFWASSNARESWASARGAGASVPGGRPVTVAVQRFLVPRQNLWTATVTDRGRRWCLQ